MAIVKSVEYVEVTIDDTTEGTWVDLTKSQVHSQCTPFYSSRSTAFITEAHYNRLGEVQFRDNSGTPQVRVSATARVDTDDCIFQIFVIEWASAITVQQVSVTGLTHATASYNQAITDVGDQTTAFLMYSYQYTDPQATLDHHNDACIQVRWNTMMANTTG